MLMPAPANIVIRLDEKHHILVVEDSRAWVAETVNGVRVSITWMRQPAETLDDFTARVTRLGKEAISGPSPEV
jgi:hypothetical protein